MRLVLCLTVSHGLVNEPNWVDTRQKNRSGLLKQSEDIFYESNQTEIKNKEKS